MVSPFKTLLLALCLSLPSLAIAQGIGKVKFGASYDETLENVKEAFGTPMQATFDEIVFTDKQFEGFVWNKITFRFRNGQLNEARFYMRHKSKTKAKSELEAIAKNLAQKHVLSLDYEEDGTRFYAGGLSPLGIGRLFTVFVSPYKGQWSDQLRFGPFKFKNS